MKGPFAFIASLSRISTCQMTFYPLILSLPVSNYQLPDFHAVIPVFCIIIKLFIHLNCCFSNKLSQYFNLPANYQLPPLIWAFLLHSHFLIHNPCSPTMETNLISSSSLFSSLICWYYFLSPFHTKPHSACYLSNSTSWPVIILVVTLLMSSWYSQCLYSSE